MSEPSVMLVIGDPDIDIEALTETLLEALDLTDRGYCTYHGAEHKSCCTAWQKDANARVFASELPDVARQIAAALTGDA